jgi:hypothetical protein
MWGVGESTKGKIKAIDLYVCLFLQAPRVQQKKILSAVGYNAKEFQAL